MFRERNWIEAMPRKHAYRCLPLAMANQLGWFIPCPTTVKLNWNGGDRASDLIVECAEPEFSQTEPHPMIGSHFGTGIVTFSIPYFFRTTVEGIGLRVDGPPNSWLPNITPLTGVVETWSTAHVSTFTMNWRVTALNTDVIIPAGYPICCLSLLDFYLVEAPMAVKLPLTLLAEQPLNELKAWMQKRDDTLANPDGGIDGSYIRHRDTTGTPLTSPHWRSFAVPNFVDAVADLPESSPTTVNTVHDTEERSNAIIGSHGPQDGGAG